MRSQEFALAILNQLFNKSKTYFTGRYVATAGILSKNISDFVVWTVPAYDLAQSIARTYPGTDMTRCVFFDSADFEMLS